MPVRLITEPQICITIENDGEMVLGCDSNGVSFRMKFKEWYVAARVYKEALAKMSDAQRLALGTRIIEEWSKE